jgi:WD40 repeat protein
MGHKGWVLSVDFSPDGLTVASGSEDHTIKLWDIQTGNCRATLNEHEKDVRHVSFAPNSNSMVVSCSGDGTVRLWDVRSGKCKNVLSCERLYEGMDITKAKGLSEYQKRLLRLLGASWGDVG